MYVPDILANPDKTGGRILLFLGSGISYPSGLPDIRKITDCILYEEWHSHTDEDFYSGPQPNEFFKSSNWVTRIQPFLRRLKFYADDYAQIKGERKASYEELYFLCKQIQEEEYTNTVNPLLCRSIQEIKSRVQDLLEPLPLSLGKQIELAKLASRACDFIEAVLHRKLWFNHQPKGLDILGDLASQDFKSLKIFTLNHDFLVERYFQQNRIPCVDGFDNPSGDVRYFNRCLYDSNPRISLFKLHGSVNWFVFRHPVYGDRLGIPLIGDIDHCRDEGGSGYLTRITTQPVAVTGLYDKPLRYTYGVISEMHFQFHKALHDPEYKTMVMSGYGWNDQAINWKLTEWFALGKKVILLHEEPEEIGDRSMSRMWRDYNKLVTNGLLIPIRKWFKDIKYADIKPFLT